MTRASYYGSRTYNPEAAGLFDDPEIVHVPFGENSTPFRTKIGEITENGDYPDDEDGYPADLLDQLGIE